MKENRPSFFEALITVCIILVIIHTFLEDFSVLIGWDNSVNTILMMIGFAFDLLFTIEFLVRLFNALSLKRAKTYLFRERGWIDFFASIPLLLFNSGPTFVFTVLGITSFGILSGILNVLKLIKAIRIARILRLLRVIKIFRNIKYADSVMAQRHVTRIVTTAVAVIVFSIFGLNLVGDIFDVSQSKKAYNDEQYQIIDLIKTRSGSEADLKGTIRSIASIEQTHPILIVKKDNETLYTRNNKEYYDANFNSQDYDCFIKDGIEIFIDARQVNYLKELDAAKTNLISFFIIIILMGIFLFSYSPHFAITVSDPLSIMKNGMSEHDYNLEVKIPPFYREDEVFQLARLFNEHYLPFKDRNIQSSMETSLKLKMDDLKDIIDQD